MKRKAPRQVLRCRLSDDAHARLQTLASERGMAPGSYASLLLNAVVNDPSNAGVGSNDAPRLDSRMALFLEVLDAQLTSIVRLLEELLSPEPQLVAGLRARAEAEPEALVDALNSFSSGASRGTDASASTPDDHASVSSSK